MSEQGYFQFDKNNGLDIVWDCCSIFCLRFQINGDLDPRQIFERLGDSRLAAHSNKQLISGHCTIHICTRFGRTQTSAQSILDQYLAWRRIAKKLALSFVARYSSFFSSYLLSCLLCLFESCGAPRETINMHVN